MYKDKNTQKLIIGGDIGINTDYIVHNKYDSDEYGTISAKYMISPNTAIMCYQEDPDIVAISLCECIYDVHDKTLLSFEFKNHKLIAFLYEFSTAFCDMRNGIINESVMERYYDELGERLRSMEHDILLIKQQADSFAARYENQKLKRAN